jgi:peptidoglycan/xylan/chitin deacetylase (PgdA/CDA1 family)
MRLYRPTLLQKLVYPEALFRVKTVTKVLYLTFDDGPDSLSTIPLLKILSEYGIKAVFFCTGKAASEYPEIMGKIRSDGHLIGNHSYDHPDGLFTKNQQYLNNVGSADKLTSPKLFRPPYGRLKLSQYYNLKKSYKIIMWDIMPYDFDSGFGGSRSLNVLKRYVRPGSVIVLHDTNKSTCLEFLEEFIVYATGKGYTFDIPLI